MKVRAWYAVYVEEDLDVSGMSEEEIENAIDETYERMGERVTSVDMDAELVDSEVIEDSK